MPITVLKNWTGETTTHSVPSNATCGSGTWPSNSYDTHPTSERKPMPLPLSLPQKWVLGRTSLLVRGVWVSSMPGSSCIEAQGMEFSCFHFGEVELRAGLPPIFNKCWAARMWQRFTGLPCPGCSPNTYPASCQSCKLLVEMSQALQSLLPPPCNLTHHWSSWNTSIPV